MSVAKSGADDANCGFSNRDILHQAICRLYARGITVVAAAANERRSAAGYVPAAYNEVITVSALADTDGRAGGLGGNRCYSWGGYDSDDTFANFSNYGSDVDLIAPGKCIWSTKPGPTYGYSSGTSMAAPAVTGAVALYKATRPLATPAEVNESLRYLGNLGWYTLDGPGPLSRAAARRVPHRHARHVLAVGADRRHDHLEGRHGVRPGHGHPDVHLLRARPLHGRRRAVRLGRGAAPRRASSAGPRRRRRSGVTVPSTAKPGTYHMQVTGTNWGRTKSTTLTVAGRGRPADREGAGRVGPVRVEPRSVVDRRELRDAAGQLVGRHGPVGPDRALRDRAQRQRRRLGLDEGDVGVGAIDVVLGTCLRDHLPVSREGAGQRR